MKFFCGVWCHIARWADSIEAVLDLLARKLSAFALKSAFDKQGKSEVDKCMINNVKCHR